MGATAGSPNSGARRPIRRTNDPALHESAPYGYVFRVRLTLCQGLVGLLAALAMGCGDGASGGSPLPGSAPADPSTDDCTEFEGTFSAIQEVVFEKRGCTAQVCHGASAIADLDLRAGVSYENLVEAPSSGTSGRRVVPGDRERSVLYAKLAAATIPGSVQISGAPMPSGMPPISLDELEAIQKWINAGAPATGTVEGTQTLLDACLPTPEPISIIPLSAPDPNKGVQFRLPPIELPAGSEREVCFATYYDFTDEVPERYKTAGGEAFFYDGYEVRQDAVTHHLIFFLGTRADGTPLRAEDLSDWTCADGDLAGTPCDPRDADACGGGGICRTPVRRSLACVGYASSEDEAFFPSEEIAVQQAQSTQNLFPGTYRTLPIEAVVLWNSHSFNTTTEAHVLRGRINLNFADDRRHPQKSAGGFDTAFGIPKLFTEGAPPYSEGVLCERMIVPTGTRITGISSHTHSKGKRFWYENPDGEIIYESFIYNDPLNLFLEEPLAYDDPDPARRTLTYCALYRNGVDEDGAPDPETVTRASRIEYPIPLFGDRSTLGFCEPTQCVNEGRLDVVCDDGIANRRGDDAACDSSPGAGDGWCDACSVTGGITTQNEMFGAQIWYFIDDGFPADAAVDFPDSFGFNIGPPDRSDDS